MPEVPVITLEHISKRRALTNLLDEYPAPEKQVAILKQLLEPPIVNELPRLFDIEKIVQKLLTPTMLQSFSKGERGTTRIAALVRAFPNKKDEIAVKILHLDTFKILAQSPADVQTLIDVFEKHKNGIAHLVFHKEVFPTLAINPAAIKSLIDLFPELPDYKTLIAHHVFAPQMLHGLINQKTQNAIELATIFPQRKDEIAEVIFEPTMFKSLVTSSNFSFANFTAGFHEYKERIALMLSDPELLQSLVRQGTHKVAELCRVFAEYPKLIKQIAEEVLENQTFDSLIKSSSQVHDLTTIAVFINTLPTFNDRLAQKIETSHKLTTLIKSSVDIGILTSALPDLKDTIAQTALKEATFQSLLNPPQSWVKPIKRIEGILSALPDHRAAVAQKILAPHQLQKLISNVSDVELLLKALPEFKNEITDKTRDLVDSKVTTHQQRTIEVSEKQPRMHTADRFFTSKDSPTPPETPQHTEAEADQIPDTKSNKPK